MLVSCDRTAVGWLRMRGFAGGVWRAGAWPPFSQGLPTAFR